MEEDGTRHETVDGRKEGRKEGRKRKVLDKARGRWEEVK